MTPLSMINTGTKVVVQEITGGMKLRNRLIALGILPGAEIEVLNNPAHGPFIMAVKGSRIAIGRGMASRIIVG